MMQIRIVWMPVHEPRVPVLVRVRLAAVPPEVVLMLVMLVVHVGVVVRHRLVHMRVLVALGRMQPHA